jgi:Tfp pilus tip-associated adhesin PilY1
MPYRTKKSVTFIGLVLTGISSSLHSASVHGSVALIPPGPGAIALQDHDVQNGETIAYRPWFDPVSGRGDLIEYTITAAGSALTDVNTGAIPPVPGSTGGCHRTTGGCWSAGAAYHANGADDPHAHYWQQRNLFTGNNGQADFTWDQLGPGQQALLDSATAALPVTPQGAWDSEVLNYIRGKRLHEQQHATLPGSSGLFRSRASVLGDITSTPAYIGPPRELLGHVAGYNAFTSAHQKRDGRVAVGSNDGMLHVFDTADGTEVYAYIPSMLLDKLGKLTGYPPPWQHRYHVAGEQTVASVELGRSNWRTLLVGGGGPGFAGLYALDVTDPAFTHDKLLFEKHGGWWGHVYGQPRIGRVGSPPGNAAWYVFSGNGAHPSARHPTALILIDLETLAETAVALPGVTGGLSAPVLLSTDDNDTVELAFAGDMNGDLWMFAIDATSPGSSSAVRIYQGNSQHPIRHAPAIAKHPTAPGYLVYFASRPLPGSGTSGTIQAIWLNTADPAALHAALPYTDSDLLTRTFTSVPVGTATQVRIVSDHNPVQYHCPTGVSPCPALHRGWRIKLPDCGEQLNGKPRVRAGRLQFTTTSTASGCAGGRQAGGNWTMSLDYLHGHDNGRTVYDLNNDNIIDHRDSISLSGKNTPPVGIQLADGNISPPVHIRVDASTDRLVINRLLPLAAVNPAPGMAGNNRPGHGPLPAPARRKPAQPGVSLTDAQPVIMPVTGTNAKTGRRSWIDLVE